MRNKQSLSALFLLGLGLTSSAFAADVSLQGTIPGVVLLHQRASLAGLSNSVIEKEVIFQRIVLSDEAQKNLALQADALEKPAPLSAAFQALPAAKLLDMNGVPVLDQGQHGACVTFAVTGALNAAVGEATHTSSDDHYSELCSLELGSTLESQSPVNKKGEHIYPSGWDGSWGTLVVDQISKHGLITKKYQHTQGCAGVRQYPLMVEKDHGRAMKVADFDKNSEKVISLASYKIILSPETSFSSGVDKTAVLQQVKSALVNNHRVTFGTLLDVSQGNLGALGSYKTSNDTWILTPEIKQNAKANKIEAGHEMIIIGYDDNAVVTGPENEKHKGVLTLRNSWGVEAGDQGNYYMTYDHFKLLTNEVIEFIPAKK